MMTDRDAAAVPAHAACIGMRHEASVWKLSKHAFGLHMKTSTSHGPCREAKHVKENKTCIGPGHEDLNMPAGICMCIAASAELDIPCSDDSPM